MRHDTRFPEALEFYPEHPSNEKTGRIQTTPSPLLKQEAPFEVKVLCMEFEQDMAAFLNRYEDKRFEVTGTVISVGPDIHQLPTVQLSDAPGGRCFCHCIFPSEDILRQVSVGDRVVIRSNYLVMSNLYGVVMKYSELVK